MEIVSKWLSTRTAFAGDKNSSSSVQDALYEQYKDDEEMLKAHGLSDHSQKSAPSFAPQLINLDEVMLINTSSDEYPGCTTFWFFNGDTRVTKMSYEDAQALLLQREAYVEKTKHELLTILMSKIG